jgi:hypothetical protein
MEMGLVTGRSEEIGICGYAHVNIIRREKEKVKIVKFAPLDFS